MSGFHQLLLVRITHLYLNVRTAAITDTGAKCVPVPTIETREFSAENTIAEPDILFPRLRVGRKVMGECPRGRP